MYRSRRETYADMTSKITFDPSRCRWITCCIYAIRRENRGLRLHLHPSQDLEYPGFEVEDQVWNRLLELRASKIHKELELKKQQRLFAVMKRKLEALQADCDSVDAQVCRPLSRGVQRIYGTKHHTPEDRRLQDIFSSSTFHVHYMDRF